MKICGVCKLEKLESEFATKKTGKSGHITLQWQCKSCHSLYRKEHYQQNKTKYLKKARTWGNAKKASTREFLLKYYKAHPCTDCGESNPVVLEFDHVNGTKVNNVSEMHGHSTTKLLKEIEKCEVVCANCHRIRTANRSGYWQTK